LGRVSEYALEQEARGYYEAEGNICDQCVSDAALKTWIKENVVDESCTFCGDLGVQSIAASFDDFVGVVMDGIHFDWNNFDDEGITYISSEGGYLAPSTSTRELLEDYRVSNETKVINAILDVVVNNDWVSRGFYRGSESEQLAAGWDSFKRFVKHKSRFFFLEPEELDFAEPSPGPAEMLDVIAGIIRGDLSSARLINTIDEKQKLFRVRIGEEEYFSAADLGSPPIEAAKQANRMSPAGIPMFYGAFDHHTAFSETFDASIAATSPASLATFQPTRNLTVLDLSALPPIPSVFDEKARTIIHALRFLHAFSKDISKPIERDNLERIEYVPTQIVSEYFRRVFRDSGNKPLDGIVYSSARNIAAKAVVLFCENEDCVDADQIAPSDAMLKLVKVEHRIADQS
jgi:hypothetical protein